VKGVERVELNTLNKQGGHFSFGIEFHLTALMNDALKSCDSTKKVIYIYNVRLKKALDANLSKQQISTMQMNEC